ncbi:MAG: hypothetical protein KF767_07590 [Bdellovibrionaceae bacterium]|nr:hypothetical protein [Pseudobdellovibrionaceae bacterium]
MVQLDFLLAHPPKSNDFTERVEWLVNVFTWLKHPARRGEEKVAWERTMSVRLKFLLKLLEQNPTWRKSFVTTLSLAVRDMSGVALFARAGLSAHPSFLQDLLQRFQEKILPQAPFDQDLPSFLREIFPQEEDSLLVTAVDEDVLKRVVALFADDVELIRHLDSELRQTAQILATQTLHSALLFSAQESGRLEALDKWPEKQLVRWTDRVAADVDGNGLASGDPAIKTADFRELLERCRERIARSSDRFTEYGISVDQVYLLKQRRRWLDRLEIVIELLLEANVRDRKIRAFIAGLISDLHQSRSFQTFMRENLSLLSQRIVQRQGEVGEHYVTYDWKQFRHMFLSAAGGGAVTSLTVFMKLLLSKLHAPGFIQGFIDSTNYAVSFLAIQFSGFTLATKQPSATAPYLAAKLKLSLGEARKAIIALLRTQFIAVLGNVSFVIPLCLSVSWLSVIAGAPTMSKEKALYTLWSTDIFGPTALWAIFTGFLLFSASLVGGWFENWVVLHRLPERLENNLASVRYFGRGRLFFAGVLRDKANAIAANVSLGFMLGLLPQVLAFLGLPLEVRHVTLSTGAFFSALPHLWSEGLGWGAYARALSGIGLIGLLNVGVSFSIAFLLAASSSGVRVRTFLSLIRWSLGLVLTKPWLLVVPEKRDS